MIGDRTASGHLWSHTESCPEQAGCEIVFWKSWTTGIETPIHTTRHGEIVRHAVPRKSRKR